jgi:hypothetical protein
MSIRRNCTDIPTNPDMAGLGICLSIYITALIISLVPNIEDLQDLHWELLIAVSPNVFTLGRYWSVRTVPFIRLGL